MHGFVHLIAFPAGTKMYHGYLDSRLWTAYGIEAESAGQVSCLSDYVKRVSVAGNEDVFMSEIASAILLVEGSIW